MPISYEVIKQFLLTRVVPPLAGAAATWITVHLHFLSLFHFSADETAKAITEASTFLLVTALAWASTHFSLKGHYLSGKAGPDR